MPWNLAKVPGGSHLSTHSQGVTGLEGFPEQAQSRHSEGTEAAMRITRPDASHSMLQGLDTAGDRSRLCTSQFHNLRTMRERRMV
jgi:hypothetical protein